MTNTEKKLRAAAVRAFQAGRPVNSLMELETSFGGPSCGAAGGIARKWSDGVVEAGLVLRYVRNGGRSEIHVSPAADVTVEQPDRLSNLVLVTPKTPAAKTWFDENVHDALWSGRSLAVDVRYLDNLVEGLEEAGLVVA